jgi:hypothetical protein
MSLDIIQARLDRERPLSPQHEHNLLCQIMQEVALSSLARAGFFKHAIFHGGTALRIVHGLPRFSEDLDFVLAQTDPNFEWTPFAVALKADFALFGVNLQIDDRQRSQAVKGLFIKDDSLGKLLALRHGRDPRKKLVVKLEIDCRPPARGGEETAYLLFPTAFAVVVYDLPAGFSGKLHALLCRSYLKGRDWFDFIWYLASGVVPDMQLLRAALEQQGPWQGEGLSIDTPWLRDALAQKIAATDFAQAANDVRRFLPQEQLAGLDVWSQAFFQAQLPRIGRGLR